ncbi:hypothetical protein PSAC2689_180059 [Paraburkholderia sacchari]|uniref:hypothetical protein n=1 Tax=Paraburkholderia sacchari TaxID=159450 RepID=UPI0039A75822
MLTDSQRDIIKATIPLLETGGEALTQYFYRSISTSRCPEKYEQLRAVVRVLRL